MMPSAREVINRMHENHYIIIWTCRTGQYLLDAVNWLLACGIKFDRVNDHQPDNAAQYGDAGKKIFAHCYIDDRNIGGFPGWVEVEQMIINMESEEKKE
jgi:hypothetical protein